MATKSITVGTSGGRTYDTTATILAASSTKKIVTGFSITWGDAYVGNYADSSTQDCHINFRINGATAAVITYTTTSRPPISVTGLNIGVNANTAMTLEIVRDFNQYISEAENRRNWIHIREAFTVTVTYTETNHPVVATGDIITKAQMDTLRSHLGQGTAVTQYNIATAAHGNTYKSGLTAGTTVMNSSWYNGA